MLIATPSFRPQRNPRTGEMGHAVSMRQALTYARLRKPHAVALPKRRAGK